LSSISDSSAYGRNEQIDQTPDIFKIATHNVCYRTDRLITGFKFANNKEEKKEESYVNMRDVPNKNPFLG